MSLASFSIKKAVSVLILLLLVASLSLSQSPSESFASTPSQTNPLSSHWVPTNPLSSHWVPNWGYRDELNASDIDNKNFWMDNAGKILVMSALTHDFTDANRSLDFIERYLSSSDNYYLPELLVNSSFPALTAEGSTLSISNGIVELTATNNTLSHFDQLSVGTSYTGTVNLGYLGGDRIWFNNGTLGHASTSVSSRVFEIPNGFSKRSLFDVSGSMYYVYVNATIAKSNPFVNVSIQAEPIGSTTASLEYIYLQAFNSTSSNPFFAGGLYSSSGTFIRNLPFNDSNSLSSGGVIMSYSNETNVFTGVNPSGETGQDALALRFGYVSIYDWEHWAENGAFNNSWFGVGYNVPRNVPSNTLSQPIYSEIYPLLHFDYHLANDTVRYITSTPPSNVAVSPPVSFGFISYGLALEAAMNPTNLTLNNLARGYWNYYYSNYDHVDYSTPYARSINLLALAGFTLYGCNSTVETFTRNFLGNTSGSAIEEYGWGVAALYKLKTCTNSPSDVSLFDSFVNSFGTSKSNFIIRSSSTSTDLNPSFTFQFGEAASGLMLGGVPYNDPVVLEAMDAVYQSNVSGILLNQPYHGDLANTETIPAILLSTYLFQNEMRNETGGYWISGIQNANVTSIDYVNGTLLISAIGNNGTIEISSPNGSNTVRNINGLSTTAIALNSVTKTNPVTITTNIDLCGPTDLSGCNSVDWTIFIASIVVFIAGALLAVRSIRLERRIKAGREL